METVFAYFWGIPAEIMLFVGFIIVPATLYGVLLCIKNTLDGKTVKEYLKTFIWTSVGLIFSLSPAVTAAFLSLFPKG